MKIAISYPPLPEIKGTPMVGQNRQYQIFSRPTYIYPMVPAYAATLLAKNGYEVFWDDGIAENLSYEQWQQRLSKEKPDLVAMETKTPVVKRHWKIIQEIKNKNQKIKIILMGDHVTALPKESLKNSKVDYVLSGGDYDFMLLNLANHLTQGEKLEPGWYYKDENGEIKNTGPFRLNHNLDDLPFIDRELTKWELYAYKNGNFKRTPGTYTLIGRDCWHRKNGGCTFCSWTTIYPTWRVRKPELLVDEIGFLIKNYGVKTVFDDTGTFPIGSRLRKFCKLMIERGYNKEIEFSCNMRFGACNLEDYKLMKKAGFKMLLFGLECVNQKTLNEINKNLKVEQIIDSCKKAKQVGLSPHITIMLGFPKETKKDALKTVELVKNLLKNDYADTLQATLIIPYPGTALFKKAKKRGWLKTSNWDRYDMGEPILKTEMRNDELMKLIQQIYKVAFDPKLIARKLASIRSLEDVKFILRAGKKVLGHLKDFRT